MVILFGIPWQFSTLMLGINHGPSNWEAGFILLGLMHSNAHWLVPLYFMGLLSGFRYRLVLKGNLRTSHFMFGVECKVKGCLWATPICEEPGQAYAREEIHTKATGHFSYSLIAARETQLEVI